MEIACRYRLADFFFTDNQLSISFDPSYIWQLRKRRESVERLYDAVRVHMI
jgi:hypothetical protein